MLRHVEVGRHAAVAVDAAAERDRAQVAAQVVAPGVIDALEVLHAAAVLQADQRAAMRAAVLESAKLAVLGAHHDDGHAADEGRAVVADGRQIEFEAEIVPDRAFEDALLLGGEHVLVGVHPVGHAGQARRPDAADIRSVIASIGNLPRSSGVASSIQPRVRHARGHQHIDRSGARGKQRGRAGVRRGAGRHHVVDQQHPLADQSARPRRPHQERARHLRRALHSRLLAERGGGTPAQQGVQQARATGRSGRPPRPAAPPDYSGGGTAARDAAGPAPAGPPRATAPRRRGPCAARARTRSRCGRRA